MCDVYPIVFEAQQVGTATIRYEGLYAHLSCRCVADHEAFYRVVTQSSCGKIDLGTCLKDADGYYIACRIPRRLLSGILRFSLIKAPGQKHNFYPIKQGAAFQQLERLTAGVLTCRDGVMGLLISK